MLYDQSNDIMHSLHIEVLRLYDTQNTHVNINLVCVIYAIRTLFFQTTNYKGRLVDWYVINGPYPDPFVYGWYRDKLPIRYAVELSISRLFKIERAFSLACTIHVTTHIFSGERIPGFFWFRGYKGWASQTFYNVTEAEPPADIFTVPQECNNAKNCGYL